MLAGNSCNRIEIGLRQGDLLNRVLQRIKAVDLDFHNVSGRKKPWRRATGAYTGRRSGKDQVTRHQSEKPGEMGDQKIDVEDQLTGRGVLYQFVIEPGMNSQVVRILNFARRRDADPRGRQFDAIVFQHVARRFQPLIDIAGDTKLAGRLVDPKVVMGKASASRAVVKDIVNVALSVLDP